MKKFFLVLFGIILLCGSMTACTDSSSATIENNEKDTYEVYIEIKCEENLLFSKYNLDVYVDDEYETYIEHGKLDFFYIELVEGEHEIMVQKEDETGVSGTISIDVNDNAEYYYIVKCKKNEVEIEKVDTSSVVDKEEMETEVADEDAKKSTEETEEGGDPYTIDYEDATSFEMALNNGQKVIGKIVQFEVNEYNPTSLLGINCWAGEHLNFILEKELDIKKGDIIVGRITKEATKVLTSSWKIPFEVIEITENDIKEEVNNEISSENSVEGNGKPEIALTENQIMSPASAYILENDKVDDVIELFSKAGFTNVQTQAIYDLDYTSAWSSAKWNWVEKVSINENDHFEEGDIFEKDSLVIITYHEFEKDDPSIVYNTYTVSELLNDLESNPMRAKDEHLYEYVEIEGKISEISPHGNYILICATNDIYELDFIYCGTKTDELKDYIYDLSKGDVVTVRGKINVVDTIYDYTMDVYSFQ